MHSLDVVVSCQIREDLNPALACIPPYLSHPSHLILFLSAVCNKYTGEWVRLALASGSNGSPISYMNHSPQPSTCQSQFLHGGQGVDTGEFSRGGGLSGHGGWE
jgi:hypothetical protein